MFSLSVLLHLEKKSLKVKWPSLASKNVSEEKKSFIGSVTGVNFIKVLWTAFALIGPKSNKWHCWLDWLFAHLGSTCVKAVHRTLMKLSPGRLFELVCMYYCVKNVRLKQGKGGRDLKVPLHFYETLYNSINMNVF